ncbi:cytochrome P450 [Ustulina deusta]|nr:cytochrome P450 [Ustulina deusta]
MGSISTPVIFCAVIFLALFNLLPGFIHWFLHLRPSRHDLILTQVERDRKIADFSFWDATKLDDRLKLRAKPNARLITAFHLNNSFTTTDTRVHQEFLKKATRAIHLVRTDDWVQLGTVTQTILNFCLNHFKEGLPYIPLASLVRVVSFSVVLHVLFEIEPSELNLDEARRATEAINRLWIRSKECHSIPSLYDQRVLNNALEILLPNKFPCDDRTHPLNLIIPAYETLWRVVLLTFVAIASRNLDSRITEELEDAIKSVPQCFCLGNDSEMRALAIAKEGLRLYPPTKRIYRAAEIVVAANVEACHQNDEVWGANALYFDPTRFHNWHQNDTITISSPIDRPLRQEADDLKTRSYFPFGAGRHTCPAAAGFGDKMITLLVVEFARRFGTRQTGLKIHLDKIEFRPHLLSPLPTRRSDMENWVLELEAKEGN